MSNDPAPAKSSMTWLWILGGIILLAVLVFGGIVLFLAGQESLSLLASGTPEVAGAPALA
ncbi:hypothetical protein NBM05_02065 [Rothia sp. AR01]|uniref:Uncharacterized protein n=1 Tax=Rothia santali TaxID=2949643 RepID=A0A9X2HDF4_9MICC|nr:hypothetical protein [Rothia santali]MCP3424847.1 hypothetical protein [Rothia santali]